MYRMSCIWSLKKGKIKAIAKEETQWDEHRKRRKICGYGMEHGTRGWIISKNEIPKEKKTEKIDRDAPIEASVDCCLFAMAFGDAMIMMVIIK